MSQQTVTDQGQERRRRRNERGVTSTQYGQNGSKVPLPQRERRPVLAVAAVLLIVLGAAVAGLVALQTDQRITVLVARTDVTAGQQIDASNLTSARVAVTGIRLVPLSDEGSLVGQVAQVNIAAGTLIDRSMVGTKDVVPSGAVAIGLSLKAGQYPYDLEVGDRVDVVSVPSGGSVAASSGTSSGSAATATTGTVLVSGAKVIGFEVTSADSGSDGVAVTIAAPTDKEAGITAGASTQTIALARSTRNTGSSGGG